VARRRAVEIGYALSSEERQPQELVKAAQLAEAIGFPFALILEHFHPWTDAQGSSPFVWAVLGAIAATTRRLRVGTGVTCPIMRLHPAIVAQASATIACRSDPTRKGSCASTSARCCPR
jgi:coenzyme F420-dependent glucose-6-phosphate dehydrogenase